MFSIKFIKESNKLARRLSSLSFTKLTNLPCHNNPFSATLLQSSSHQVNKFQLEFKPTSISLNIIPTSIRPKIENPLANNIIVIDDPLRSTKEIIEKPNSLETSFELPATVDKHGEDGMQAIVMIGVRKRKMKKHKLRKLRKKMKFEWAKVRQRRELRKEKAFQAGLIAKIKETEKFSAEAYVNEKLKQANETPIPRFWKGRQLPAFIIKQKMGIKD